MQIELDIVTWLLQPIAIVVCGLVAYVYLFREKCGRRNGHYTNPDWNFHLKKWWALMHITQRKRSESKGYHKSDSSAEEPKILQREESADSVELNCADQRGTSIFLKITRRRHRVAEVWIVVRLSNGQNYYLPNHPDTVIANNNSKGWCAAGLSFRVLEPYRKWRVTFNGLLRRGRSVFWCDESSQVVHVRFNFIWTAASTPMTWPHDWSPQLSAEAIAREPWKDGDWPNMIFKHSTEGYDQFGCLSGTFDAFDCSIIDLTLPGVKTRRWGPHKVVHMHRTASFTGVFADGSIFLVEANSALRGLTHYIYGVVRMPNGEVRSIEKCDLNLPHIAENKNDMPRSFELTFSARGVSFTNVIELNIGEETNLFGGRPWEWEVSLVPLKCKQAGARGFGFAQFWYKYQGDCPVPATPRVRHLIPTSITKYSPLILNLNEHTARCTALVGGKASSLALLKSVQGDEYSVPDGICLTVDALNFQLKHHANLRDVVKLVENVSCGICSGNLEDVCQKAVSAIQKTNLSETLHELLIKSLSELRSQSPDKSRFAVRSSAICEDSEELSFAGQCDSILGCYTDLEIENAVKHCWASLYSYRSVYYRRHYGQLINCGMGVVIQVMVPAEKAGVMFTRHPVTGDPSQIYITANYGLGVSVSSGAVEPDTLIVLRNWHDHVEFGTATRGSKSYAVVMQNSPSEDNESSGIKTRPLTSEEMKKQICLSEKEAERLAKLGVRLESLYGAPRDIEWAICEKGKIFLLQARPITAIGRFSDHELLHEHDTPTMTSEDVTTFGGAAEAFPGVATPLTLSAILPRLDRPLLVLRLGKPAARTLHAMVISHHRVTSSSITHLMTNTEDPGGINDLKRDPMHISVCGARTAIQKNIKQQPIPNDNLDRLRILLNVVKSTWNVKKHVRDLQDFLDQFELDQCNCGTALELYQRITDDLPHLGYVAMLHYRCSAVSVISHVIALLILAEKNKELRSDHLHDAFTLISACSNADGQCGQMTAGAAVATALHDMAADIKTQNLDQEFRDIPAKDARRWLRERCPRAARRLDAFLRKHGHRALRELDLYTETWGLRPETLLVALQAALAIPVIRPAHEGFKHPLPIADLIANLKSPKHKVTRILLEKIIPFCRKSVARRETTKTATVSVIHSFRLAYRRLAQMMQRDGLLPEQELIFFMSHQEIGKVLKTRDPTLLSKAWRRKRLFPHWEAMRFNNHSHKTMNCDTTELKNSISVEGTLISESGAEGRACVLHNYDEVHNIKQGDILITISTDIGWSPYFPMLAGLVTELGGLISHGALVAREFGLPCMVGAHGATDLFSTGDYVKIDATSGLLLKLS